MFRITSQLCEVFDCTDQQLEDSGVLRAFNAWLQQHPEVVVCHDIEYGERINGEIAVKFFEFYKARRAN